MPVGTYISPTDFPLASARVATCSLSWCYKERLELCCERTGDLWEYTYAGAGIECTPALQLECTPRGADGFPSRAQKEIALWRRQLIKLQKAYSQDLLGKPGKGGSPRGWENTAEALRVRIEQLEARIEQRQAHRKSLPHKVPVGEGQDPEQIVRLAPELKLLTDLVTMVAYRAESAMLPGVGLLKREAEEGRAFLKALFRTPADLIPLKQERLLLVRCHSRAQPRFNSALRTLCDAATLGRHRYPGTDLRMVFQGPSVTNETAPCQEV